MSYLEKAVILIAIPILASLLLFAFAVLIGNEITFNLAASLLAFVLPIYSIVVVIVLIVLFCINENKK